MNNQRLGRTNVRNTASSSTAEAPTVICLDKDECSQMGNKPSTPNCGAENTEEMETEENSDSPIMFPSRKSDEIVNNDMKEESEKIFVEIIDEEDQKESKDGCDTENTNKRPTNNSRSRLILRRKRQLDDNSANNEDSGTDTSKRKCLLDIKTSEVKQTPSSKDKTKGTAPPSILLQRLFKRKICTTLEEADKLDLYFAPRDVLPSNYAKVIIRKFDNYKRRLRILQSRAFTVHPLGKPIEQRPLVTSRHALRRTVLRKLTKEVKSPPRNNIEADQDIFGDERLKTPAKNKTRNIESETTVTSAKTSLPTTSGIVTMATSSPSTSTAIQSNIDDDVVITGATTTPESSPVKILNKTVRRAILNESSSDEDEPKFSFNHSDPKETVSEEKPKQEPVPLNEEKTKESCVTKEVECPMCFRMFAEDKVEDHAASCNGQLNTRSTRDSTMAEETKSPPNTTTTTIINIEDEQNSSEKGPDCEKLPKLDEEGCKEMPPLSPVIKVRTPTKVKELRILELTVPVCDLNSRKKFSQSAVSQPTIIDKLITNNKTGKQQNSDGSESVPMKTNKRRSGGSATGKKQRRASEPQARITGRNIPPIDETLLKNDFIPLEQEKKDDLPKRPITRRSLATAVPTTESDDDDDDDNDNQELKLEDIISKVTSSNDNDDDDSALDFMSGAYKGKKRKSKTTSELQLKRRRRVLRNQEDHFERCSLCDKLIPSNLYPAHVAEEIEKKKKVTKR